VKDSEKESKQITQVSQMDRATPYNPNPKSKSNPSLNPNSLQHLSYFFTPFRSFGEYRSLSRICANYMASRGPYATPKNFTVFHTF